MENRIIKYRRKQSQERTDSSGNIFFTLFGAVAVVGAIGAGSVTLLKGPVSTMVQVNQKTAVEGHSELALKLMMNDVLGSAPDCDSDQTIEAAAWRAGAGPVGGGLFPDTLDTKTTDPWGSELGYCVWDHGTAVDNAGCGGAGQLRLAGATVTDQPYIAVISAGADRVFQTSCNDYVDTTPADGNPDTPLIDKTPGSDDLIFSYTYDGAKAAMGDNWIFTADTDAADDALVTSQNLQFGQDVTFGGLLDLNKLGGGLILSDVASATCDVATDGQLFRDTSVIPPAVVLCKNGEFETIGGGTGSGSNVSSADIHWTFDDGTGSSVAADSITSNDGTLINMDINNDWVSGQSGYALDFNGPETRVAVPDPGAGSVMDFGNGDPITITAWVYPRDLSGYQIVMSKAATASLENANFQFELTDDAAFSNRLSFWFTSALSTWHGIRSDTDVLTLNAWQHIAFTGTFGSLESAKFYHNGIAYGAESADDTTFTAVPLQSDDPLWIGNSNEGAAQYRPFDGQMDDVRIYRRILTDSEITAIYDGSDSGAGAVASPYYPENGIDPNLRGYGWGDDTNGEVGNGSTVTADQVAPVAVENRQHFRQVSAGALHACGLEGDGTAWCWGDDTNLQLGDDDTASGKTEPVQVSGGPYIQISAGGDHSCALKADGTAWCWGDDTNGELGNGAATTADQGTPVQVSTITSFIYIDAGNGYTCGVTANGDAYCWGDDTNGQLGNGDTAGDQTEPSRVSDIANLVQISAGYDLTCGVTADGRGWCWGLNTNGQLGNGTTVAKVMPEQVSDYEDFIFIDAGSTHACGIRTNGMAYCWGDDTNGRLGNGATTGDQYSPSPVDTTSVSGFVDIAAGTATTCGIDSDGRGWCWGSDSDGQAGNDATAGDQISPSPVAAITYFVDIDTSGTHSAGAALSVSDGSEDAPTTPYIINQPRSAENLSGGHGLVVNLDSTTTGQEAGIGFKVDETSIADGDPVSGSITAVRNAAGSTAARLHMNTYDGTGVQTGVRIGIDGGVMISPPAAATDADAALTVGDHSTGTWNMSDYYDGFLVTRNTATDNPAYFGLENSTGDAVALFRKDFLIRKSDDTAGTVDTVLRLDDAGASAFYGDIYQRIAGGIFSIDAYTDTAGEYAGYNFMRYHGAVGSGTAVADNDLLGSVRFGGHDGTAFDADRQAQIFGKTDGAVGAGSVPAEIILRTSNAGTTGTATETLRIKADGKVGILKEAPDTNAILHVGGRGASDAGTKVGTDANCSAASDEGTLRWTGTVWEYCDGAAWQLLVSSSCTHESRFVGVDTGHAQTCAIYSNGQLSCFGENTYGESGDGTTTSPALSTEPIPRIYLNDVRQVSVGTDHACAVTETGNGYCWGRGAFGQLGNGSTDDKTRPTKIASNQGWKYVSAGTYSSCGINDDGRLYCWGGRSNYQLGDNLNTPDQMVPILISGVSNAVKLASGTSFHCALLADRTVKCWGGNALGQVGKGSAGDAQVPTAVSGLTDVVDIGGDTDNMCAVKSDGTVWCWGSNTDNGLGDGSVAAFELAPVQLSSLSNIISVDAALSKNCALKNDGTVSCWGATGSMPAQQAGLTDAVQVSAGDQNMCAILEDNTLKCWGDNTQAQNGSGATGGADPNTAINALACDADKYVFATSDTYSGDLGGLGGADAICQFRADSAGLPGTYVAWLSDDTLSPSYRFLNKATGDYKLVNGTVVANGWSDLEDGTLDNAINRDESGAAITGDVWTNVTMAGALNSSADHCSNWSDDSAGNGGRGLSTVTGTTWMDNGTGACTNAYRLYCFQQ